MFSNLYLASGLLLNATALGLLVRYLENENIISPQEAVAGILEQGSLLLAALGAILKQSKEQISVSFREIFISEEGYIPQDLEVYGQSSDPNVPEVGSLD